MAPPMRKITRLLPSLVAALTLWGGLGMAQDVAPTEPAPDASIVTLAPPPPPCGTQTISIASMQWPSAQILAEIHAGILKAQFKCDVSVVAGDMAATGSSMGTTGQPAVAPELWISRIADIWNQASKAQKVREAGGSYAEPALEGWFIPNYVAEAQPGLTNVAALLQFSQLFVSGGGKPRFISCPIDWGCAVINRNLLKANGLDALFDVVEPANRFELDTLIAAAVSRKEPILFYYWQPNAVLAQFGFKSLDLGPYDKEAFLCLGRRACAAPKPSGFAPEPVVIALAEWVFLEAPEIAAYFQRAKLPVAEMNAMLQLLAQRGATPQSIAAQFIATHAEIWRPWIGTPPVGAVTPLQ
jgi:glycine betaine/proline transport system substrate-binding protein